MKSEKGQSLVMVGVALFFIGRAVPVYWLIPAEDLLRRAGGNTDDGGAIRYHDAVGCRHRWSIRCKQNGNGCANHRFRQRGHSQLPGEPEHGYF